ncbi:MAG: proprotein convertase P-domain-containing protein, partial [Polyangiaceae bacterium]|nr:proprotein convertase P-domain-containing protein [Polyangiaceae bacterium]
EDYDGIETWWGLCHAWTPAAILEAEPLHPVTVNGVEFTVSDIKALLIAQYDRNSALMLGGRCNEQQVERDASGRVKKTECRDANPGAFYVVMTNMLGRDKRALAEDRTFDFQVWNQPILGYRITVDQELTEEQALQKLGKTPADGKYATLFASPEAVAWRYVRMSTDYISESANTVEGPLTPNIERYTRTDNYQMIIELNKEGNVVGGEWIGYSNTTHPDFLWLPLRGQGGNPKIDMAELRNLVEMSRTTDAPPIDEHIAEFGGPADVQIPDNNPSGVTHTITIDQDVTIGSLKAQLNIEHSYVGDLRVVLVKDGTEVVLHDRTDGSGSGLNEVYPVRQFNGQSARGTWTLKLSDHAEGDTGKLVGFKLIVGSNATASTTSREYTNSTAEAIPDGNALGIASVINVSDPGTVKALKVNVNITHPYIGDLVVSIKHGGSTQVLHANEGGSADNIVKSFTVTSFNGSPLNGEWKLQVIDSERQDKGTLNSWSLTAEF